MSVNQREMNNTGELAGVRVVEIGPRGGATPGVAGAMAGKLLADLGATVVKVEPPQGDPERRRGPFPQSGKAAPAKGRIPGAEASSAKASGTEVFGTEASGGFAYLNTNKRSLVLDLEHTEREAHQARLENLLGEAHLLICDLPPRLMEALGLMPEEIARKHPHLVGLSLTPFGLSGPYRDFAADDLTVFYGGGWGLLCPGGTLTGETGEEPPTLEAQASDSQTTGSQTTGSQTTNSQTTMRPPHSPRLPIRPFGRHSLVQAGVHGVVGALAALRRARETGRGEWVDLSMQEVGTLLMGRHFAYAPYLNHAETYLSPVPYEPYSFYPTHDGFVYLICPEQVQWDRLVEVLGSPAWATDGRFDSRPLRQTNAAILKVELSRETMRWEADALYHALQAQRVGAAPVYDFPRLAREPQLTGRQFFREMEHPALGTLTLPGAPYALSRPGWGLRSPAPELGEAGGLHGELSFKDLAKSLFPADSPKISHAPREASHQGRLPLAGVRVLDFSWVWAGPHCTMLLGLLGAEVLKVENSARPDLTRRSHIFPQGMEPGLNRCGYFNSLNQNKHSVGLNLSHPEGVALAKALASKSDVMVANFGTGVLEKLGLGAQVMQAQNPSLILALISAFGQTGPCANYSGYGPLLPPLAGLSAQTGYPEGVGPWGGKPQDVGVAYGDPTGGVYAAVAVVAALLRQQSGQVSPMHPGDAPPGQVIDVSMWEAMLCTGYEGWMNHAMGNAPYRPMGNHDPLHAPHNLYACRGEDHKPGWLSIVVTDEAQWQGLCRVLELPGWADDPALATPAGRKAREAELDEAISRWCAVRERWAATRLLQDAGIPAFPALDALDLLHDPHLNARGCFTRHPHPEVGTHTLMGAPWQLHGSPNGQGKAAPLLGEDTDAVLQTLLGLDDKERQRLREAGVIE